MGISKTPNVDYREKPRKDKLIMTPQELEKFWQMVSEFESIPNDVIVPKVSWIKPIHLKHKYVLETHYCDGSVDKIEICVDFLAIRILISYLAECGVYAKATKINEEK